MVAETDVAGGRCGQNDQAVHATYLVADARRDTAEFCRIHSKLSINQGQDMDSNWKKTSNNYLHLGFKCDVSVFYFFTTGAPFSIPIFSQRFPAVRRFVFYVFTNGEPFSRPRFSTRFPARDSWPRFPADN